MKIIACTPTKNRRWAWEWSKAGMATQKLQPDVWFVLDNSTRPEDDWSVSTSHPKVRYEHVDGEKPVAWLRNRCLDVALEEQADYLIFWDDDDYYPSTRISTGIAALEANPDADIAGSSKMYLLLVRENVMMTTGPFGDTHATAATYTVRRRYFEANRFDPADVRGEERVFTKEWTAKLIQVPPEEMIVVMGHGRNTVDKSDLAVNPARYRAQIMNADNGKMVFRSRWTVQWDLWKSTFSAAINGLLPKNTPSVELQTVTVPTLHIEDTAESAEHHA
jgi:hypothetical protein